MKTLDLKWWGAYIVLDISAVGMGMGVPIFCIMLGFPFGWYAAKRARRLHPHMRNAMKAALSESLKASFITFVMMMVIWVPTISLLFRESFDPAQFGHSFILFDPFISFIGWQVLMIVISPVLQLHTGLAASHVNIMTSTGEER